MKPRRPVSSESCSRKMASTPALAAAKRIWAPDSASSWRMPQTGPTMATATKAATRSRIGGDTQIRTGDGAFAELCLTTWLCRRSQRVSWSGWRESNPRVNLGKVAGCHYITPAFLDQRRAVRAFHERSFARTSAGSSASRRRKQLFQRRAELGQLFRFEHAEKCRFGEVYHLVARAEQAPSFARQGNLQNPS